MAWHEDPKWLRSIGGVLLAAVVVLAGLNATGPEEAPAPRPARTVEVAAPACRNAVKAGKQLAKAAGTALYVSRDVPSLVRDAIAARGNRPEIDDVLARLKAVTPSLRRARALSERGDPPAWRRFDRSSARCLAEPMT